jgi:hypothetical protein
LWVVLANATLFVEVVSAFFHLLLKKQLLLVSLPPNIIIRTLQCNFFSSSNRRKRRRSHYYWRRVPEEFGHLHGGYLQLFHPPVVREPLYQVEHHVPENRLVSHAGGVELLSFDDYGEASFGLKRDADIERLGHYYYYSSATIIIG